MSNRLLSPPRSGRRWEALLAAVVLALACDGGGDSPTMPSGGPPPGPTPGSGTLRIEMTDAPIDELSQVVVFVSGLKVKPDGQPTTRFADELGPYDLLQLRGGVSQILTDGAVAAGTYQYIEILLDETRSFVVERSTGAQLPLAIASDKAKINGGPFEVFAGRRTTVRFDFDAERSLRLRGNGTWLLHPVLEVVEVRVTSNTG